MTLLMKQLKIRLIYEEVRIASMRHDMVHHRRELRMPREGGSVTHLADVSVPLNDVQTKLRPAVLVVIDLPRWSTYRHLIQTKV